MIDHDNLPVKEMRVRHDDDEHGGGVHIDGWHFRRDVSIGNLITVGLLVAGLFSWGSSIERRTSVLETAQQYSAQTDVRHEGMIANSGSQVATRLDRIEDKLQAIQTDVAALKSSVRRADDTRDKFGPR